MLPLDFSAGSGGEFRPRFPSSSFLAHSHVQIGWEKGILFGFQRQNSKPHSFSL
ncbi:hypothetical protein K435DRAFT_782773 [Dendrothele bispora CBS 962.96]|uniref:Uncharacterized protein n=1 Tax=Dendrothele bispora (strain CBS 962.96) TaxID=1314807 RepID=A0A4S8LCP7_DENBC|nr:hypothetical protein K435DRAFT_782773 [Dendrothele bispora CBS 962.96]